MKKLSLIATILIGLVSCTPNCPCTVNKVEYATGRSTDKIYVVTYVGNNGKADVIFTDSAYQVGQLIIY